MDRLGNVGWLLRRALARVRREHLARDFDEEVRQHLELRVKALIDEGMDPREAAYEARRMFGNPTLIREEARTMWGFQWMEAIGQDIRFGARLLRRSPAFTLAAVASLGIGIGAAAAVFSLADALLFRQLPVRQPRELVLFRWVSGPELPFESLNGWGDQTDTETSSTSFSRQAYERMRTELASQADVFGFADLYTVNLAIDGRPEPGAAQVASGNYFTALGITATAGRLLGDADDRAEAPPAAVIGYDLWQRRFGADPNAVGRSLLLNGVSFTIAGVLPRHFSGTLQVGQGCDVIVPLAHYRSVVPDGDDPSSPNYWWVLMMGRLRPQVTAAALQPSADLILKQTVAAAKPEFPADKRPRLRVEPGGWGQVEQRESMREPIQIMARVVAVVLLIACANVANLLLARGRARAKEIAMRTAIGAARSRVIRQLLTEGLLLGTFASITGLALAQWISSALLPALADGRQTLTVAYALDLRIVAFTSVLAIVCSVLFALGPALRSTRTALVPVLQEGWRMTAGGRRGFVAAGTLVVAQVTLSLLLVSVAALLAWSSSRLERVDVGFDPENLLTFGVNVSQNGYDETRTRAFIAAALSRLRAAPGVTAASVTSHRLISGSSAIGVSRPAGSPPLDPNSPEAREIQLKYRTWRLVVDEQFFETFRIPMLQGRTFPETVAPDGPRMVVVNESLAKLLFGGTDVIGQRIVMGLRASPPLEVVGVVKDVRYTTLRTDPPPTAYLPYRQAGFGGVTFAVRTAGDPVAATPAIREVMREVDASVPLVDLRTQNEQIRRSIDRERLFANLALMLGAVALALSGIGLYGLLAYTVTLRTQEIGVRMALGAYRHQVRWMVLRQSLLLIATGIAIGVPAALASTKYVESLLFGLSPTDPRAITGAALVMLAAGLTAAYIPARRASRIDPLVALRIL